MFRLPLLQKEQQQCANLAPHIIYTYKVLHPMGEDNEYALCIMYVKGVLFGWMFLPMLSLKTFYL